jgi:hypothetical protein
VAPEIHVGAPPELIGRPEPGFFKRFVGFFGFWPGLYLKILSQGLEIERSWSWCGLVFFRKRELLSFSQIKQVEAKERSRLGWLGTLAILGGAFAATWWVQDFFRSWDLAFMGAAGLGISLGLLIDGVLKRIKQAGVRVLVQEGEEQVIWSKDKAGVARLVAVMAVVVDHSREASSPVSR